MYFVDFACSTVAFSLSSISEMIGTPCRSAISPRLSFVSSLQLGSGIANQRAAEKEKETDGDDSIAVYNLAGRKSCSGRNLLTRRGAKHVRNYLHTSYSGTVPECNAINC